MSMDPVAGSPGATSVAREVLNLTRAFMGVAQQSFPESSPDHYLVTGARQTLEMMLSARGWLDDLSEFQPPKT